MTDWPAVPLGGLVRFINGDRGKNYPSAQHRVSSGVPFINAGHLEGGRIRMNGMDYITAARYDLLRSGKVEVDDVLLCIRGSIGRWALVTPAAVPGAIASSLVILRAGPEILPRFLAAYLDGPVGKRAILASDNGAAQPNIGAQEVSRFEVALPPLNEQARIVEILASLDDLIENNRRRVEVLEETARAIYREWFVHFRFPGHENVDTVDSDLGTIPDGWCWRPFSEVASFANGFAFKPSHWGVDGWPIIKIKELKQGVARDTPRCAPDAVDAKYRVQPGDLLFSWSADLGVYRWADEPGLLNQHLFVVRPTTCDVTPSFLYHALDEAMPHFRARAQGTTMKHIKRSALNEVMALLPMSPLGESFTDAVKPIHDQWSTLRQGTRMLSATRDLLLPKLVTGQIDVSALELDALVEGAVA